MAEKLAVLIADDSPTVRQMLAGVVNATPDMVVIGEASTGRQAVKLTRELHPDVIVMDLVMPTMDGLEATREIMHDTPTPIVVVSASLDSAETDIAFQAISAGALMVLQKPVGPLDPVHALQIVELLNATRAMAGVQVIHHYRSARRSEPAIQKAPVQSSTPPSLIAIVSSTGGPAALGEIARQLPADFPLPVVVVQHIGPDFVQSLAGWLDTVTPLRVVMAEQNDQPRPGYLYLAAGGAHLRLTDGFRFDLKSAPTTTPHMPSGDIFLESVAHSLGAKAIGIVLTGMGSDGARGLRAMFEAGAFTIAQDEATSVVFGMPREAVELHAVRQVLPLQAIPKTLISISSGRSLVYG